MFPLALPALACLVSVGPAAGQYTPVPGGWQIRLADDPNAARPQPASEIGVVEGDCRLHRRPLYPPADRAMIWTREELEKIPRSTFRPLIVAYNEPRFLFDFHAAGGLLGHLFVGLAKGDRAKWFHDWREIDLIYTEGRMIYALRDGAFPNLDIELTATPMADSVGLAVHVAIRGSLDGAKLVWAYGGASAFFTNYDMGAKEFVFSPEQCKKDIVRWNGPQFELERAFDEDDVIVTEPFSVWRNLRTWHARIRGGSSWEATAGFGAPEAFAGSPSELIASMAPATGEHERRNTVAVQSVALTEAAREGYILVGMGGRIAENIETPHQAWARALDRNRSIANRIVAHTPDPWLDAALPMMAFATEGTWGDIATVHGGWSWRFGYLGWRTGYGPVCYGWTDRLRKYIETHTTLGLVKEGPDTGALGSLIEFEPGVFYNMNEVFFDHVRHYFDYTNDLELMERIFPILDGILKWEDTRLQPGGEGLYENALNTWISDSHWYIGGQCTQASAYMLNANRFMASLASRLGKDPAAYNERVRRTQTAMKERLWMRRPGVFAEYVDTRGNKLLHPEPELPTIYHAAEFGGTDVAGPFEIYQMLHWADSNLRTDATPGGGKIVWSSNWFPNRGRTYTHSTYETAYAEEMNFALTNYLAGRADQAYALIRASLCGIYNGPTPGGLSCHCYSDGRQRANDEFADASSMWARAVVEGLFGIVPKRPDGYVQVTPQLPKSWPEASIQTPHFSYRLWREPGLIRVEWESPIETEVRWRLPFEGSHAWLEGGGSPDLEPGFGGITWYRIRFAPAFRGSLTLHYTPQERAVPERAAVKRGASWRFTLPGEPVEAFEDPQRILDTPHIENGALAGTIAGAPGPAVLFVLAGRMETGATWLPVRLTIEPEQPAPAPRLWRAPEVGERDLEKWILADLSGVFNSTVVEAPNFVQNNAPAPAMPASQVNFNYWKDHFRETHHGGRIETLSDAAWRAKINEDGIGWTRDGIPFKSPREGANIGVVTVTGGFPEYLSIPFKARGRTLYLMLSGITFPCQSHVPNVRVTLRYADGTTQIRDLVSPFTIGDCWGTWCGRYHDCAVNGFENIGGRRGPEGSADVADLTQPVEVDTEAHLVAFDLKRSVTLDSVEFEAVANDVIFGVMGATVLK